jgi:hypothetical protein
MEAARMKCISHHPIAKRMRIASGIALALSICAGSGLIPEASAQTIGSFYTSTAPGIAASPAPATVSTIAPRGSVRAGPALACW